MLNRVLVAAGLATAVLATAASAQAATLTLGTSNTSNTTTTLKGAATGSELRVQDSLSSPAVFGIYGVLTSTSPSSASAAVRGQNDGTNGGGYGIWGSHEGSGTGVYGASKQGIGVYGARTDTTGSSGAGIFGTSQSQNYGVIGESQDFVGVLGVTGSTSLPASLGYYAAVRGDGSTYPGVVGTSVTTSGVYGENTGTAPGVFGKSDNGHGVQGSSTTGYAGYFYGNAYVTKDMYVEGAFHNPSPQLRIDDPLDRTRYLQHAAVASPARLDLYTGNLTTDRHGLATVRMPHWFQALNKSFRYQLTIVGRSFAQAIVWKPLAHNRFTIRTNRPRVKVSWLVTGLRHDRYANAHPMPVIVPKARTFQGRHAAQDARRPPGRPHWRGR